MEAPALFRVGILRQAEGSLSFVLLAWLEAAVASVWVGDVRDGLAEHIPGMAAATVVSGIVAAVALAVIQGPAATANLLVQLRQREPEAGAAVAHTLLLAAVAV
jgi:hypothetical protein